MVARTSNPILNGSYYGPSPTGESSGSVRLLRAVAVTTETFREEYQNLLRLRNEATDRGETITQDRVSLKFEPLGMLLTATDADTEFMTAANEPNLGSSPVAAAAPPAPASPAPAPKAVAPQAKPPAEPPAPAADEPQLLDTKA